MWLGYEGMKGILNEDSVLLMTSLPENERNVKPIKKQKPKNQNLNTNALEHIEID